MLDRVRQALFSCLGESCAGERVLDLFSGTGSLGIEALSRGASFARFLERDVRALGTLRRNLEALGLLERAQASRADALDPEAWAALGPTPSAGAYDLIFFDPPYRLLEDLATRKSLLSALVRLAAEHLTPVGTIAFHAPRGALHPGAFDSSLHPKLREYGTNALWFLTPAAR
jgi:16S rRNA (guanine966-N2)-methyltransferase